jgi:orotidine-5'-phosphate decarboxylase
MAANTRRAFEAGCDGVISSGLEVPMLRQEVDHKLMVICPGIRPVDNKPSDDQKRTVDVAQAFNNGADYIVVGRPIRQAEQPEQLVEQMQTTIQTCFS